MPFPRILAIVQARNEWPLVGLSAIHAIGLGVQKVIIIDHQSSDYSRHGLEAISAEFPEQVEILSLGGSAFHQAGMKNLARMINSSSGDYEWVYFFDADEFMLLEEGDTLAQILSAVPAEIEAVRYEVQNWLCPSTFKPNLIDSYYSLRSRAKPSHFMTLPEELIAQEISRGEANFFDVPFGSKVIFRLRDHLWTESGSHRVISSSGKAVKETFSGRIRVAHLPFTGMDRLRERAKQGKRLRDNGFAFAHGWQSQLLWRLEEEGKIQDFWRAHSTNEDLPAVEDGRSRAVIVEDLVLIEQLSPSIELAIRIFDGTEGPGGWPVNEDSQSESVLPLHQVATAFEKITAEMGNLLEELRLLREVEHQLRPLIQAEINSRKAIEESTSWKLTRPLRSLKSTLRKLRNAMHAKRDANSASP